MKGYLGRGVRFGYGADGRGICRGVMGKIREAGLGKAWGAKMAAVEPAPEAKACEVDRIMDYIYAEVIISSWGVRWRA